MKKKKLIFVFPNYSTFVQRDIELLQERYDVITFSFNPRYKIFIPLAFIRQFFFLLFHLPSASVVVGQLAAYHTFLPVLMAKLFRKPSVIFLAGTDSAFFPSIHYGNFCRPLLRWFTIASIRLATHLAPKHESLIDFEYDYDASGAPVQGVKYFIENFKTPYTAIANGFDSNKFSPLQTERRKDTFITVAVGMDTGNINQLKGIDLILQIAPLFPDCAFTLVGMPTTTLDTLPPNVKALPLQNEKQLQQLYSSHQFYMQLSLSEGFPNAVCEAMLCGCIPIVSNVNALPEIAAEGFVLQHKNMDMLVALIQKALTSDTEKLSKAARLHIIKDYSLEIRKERLFALLNLLKA